MKNQARNKEVRLFNILQKLVTRADELADVAFEYWLYDHPTVIAEGWDRRKTIPVKVRELALQINVTKREISRIGKELHNILEERERQKKLKQIAAIEKLA